MLPKAVTPSNKHTLCQWLFLWPPIDCVILSLWKNTSSGTINYKLLLHTSRAWCCLHPAVTSRSRAEPRSKGRELLNWTRHHPLQSTIWSKMACTGVPHQNLLKKFWLLLCAEEIFSPRCLDAGWWKKTFFCLGLSLSRCSDASPPSHQDWLELFPFHALQSFVHWKNSQVFRCNSVSITDPFHLFNVVNVQIVL